MSEETSNSSQGLGAGWVAKDRMIYVYGEIDDIVAYRVKYALDRLGHENKPIRFILSSPGGSEPAGYAIYDALRQSNCWIRMECYGACMSIATLVLQGADERYLAENCDFMIHGGTLSVSSEEGVTIPQQVLVDMGRQVEKSNLRYCQIMSTRSGQTVEKIQNWCKGETFFTAEEAKNEGLADDVIPHAKAFPPPKKKKRKGK